MAGLCTAQCKMFAVLCEIIVCDLYSFELACLKKKEETDFGCSATFWFGSFIVPLGVLLVMKTLDEEWYFLVLSSIYAISTYRVY